MYEYVKLIAGDVTLVKDGDTWTRNGTPIEYPWDVIQEVIEGHDFFDLSITLAICITSRLRSTNNTNKPFPQGGVFLCAAIDNNTHSYTYLYCWGHSGGRCPFFVLTRYHK